MTISCCPACERILPRLVESLSTGSTVDYWRCECCGHAWTTAKHDTAVIRHASSDSIKGALPFYLREKPDRRRA